MRASIFPFFLSVLLVSAGAFAAEDEPDRSDVHVSGFRYSGNGCRSGSVTESLSSDARALTLIFSDFWVEAGGDTRPKQNRSCNLNFDISAPEGWQYSVFSLQFRGYAFLEAGATGSQTARWSFGSGSRSSMPSLSLQGEFDDLYQREWEVPLRNLKWSDCKKRRSSIRIDAGIGVQGSRDAYGYFTLDSIDGEIDHVYGLIWRQCDESRRPGFLAVCRAQLESRKKQRDFETFVGRAKGDDRKDVQARAQREAVAKCEESKRRLNNRGSCTRKRPVCKVENFRAGGGGGGNRPGRG